MLVCLATLGMRPGEVAALRLEASTGGKGRCTYIGSRRAATSSYLSRVRPGQAVATCLRGHRPERLSAAPSYQEIGPRCGGPIPAVRHRSAFPCRSPPMFSLPILHCEGFLPGEFTLVASAFQQHSPALPSGNSISGIVPMHATDRNSPFSLPKNQVLRKNSVMNISRKVPDSAI